MKDKTLIDDPLTNAEKPLWSGDHDTPVERFLRYVKSGGFMVQEYQRRLHGWKGPLFRGIVHAQGGMWDKLRRTFAREFQKGIVPERPIQCKDEGTLRHLARDLGMEKNISRNTPLNQIVSFIESNPGYSSFLDQINEVTKLKT